MPLQTKETRVVLSNAYDARVVGDRIYFIRNSALLAARFDPELGEVTGDPEILVRDVAVDSLFCQAQIALSLSGTLAFLPGGDRALGTIAWIDRDGEHGTFPVEPRVYGTLDLDPTDRRLAVVMGAAFYLLYSQAVRRLVTRSIRRGLVHLKKKEYAAEAADFEAAYAFFSRHSWVNRFRYLTVLSSSAYSYREMALCGQAVARTQMGDGTGALELYRQAVDEFPECTIAKTALQAARVLGGSGAGEGSAAALREE